MNEFYLSLGANIGDPSENIVQAVTKLMLKPQIGVMKLSSPYKTPPWGNENQDNFINACCLIKTEYNPDELLNFCQQIEYDLKRHRIEKWGPRTIDIDLLFSKNYPIMQSSKLTLPHPYMLERSFVLVPLKEIATDLIINNHTVSYWLEQLNVDDRIQKIIPSLKWQRLMEL